MVGRMPGRPRQRTEEHRERRTRSRVLLKLAELGVLSLSDLALKVLVAAVQTIMVDSWSSFLQKHLEQLEC